MSKKEKESLEQDSNFMIKVATFIVGQKKPVLLIVRNINHILGCCNGLGQGRELFVSIFARYDRDQSGSGLNGRAVYYLRLCQGNGSEHHI